MSESTYEPNDRRPIQSRSTRWAETTTKWLVKFGVSPNAISVVGMLAAIAAGACFGSTDIVTGTGQRVLWLVGPPHQCLWSMWRLGDLVNQT